MNDGYRFSYRKNGAEIWDSFLNYYTEEPVIKLKRTVDKATLQIYLDEEKRIEAEKQAKLEEEKRIEAEKQAKLEEEKRIRDEKQKEERLAQNKAQKQLFEENEEKHSKDEQLFFSETAYRNMLYLSYNHYSYDAEEVNAMSLYASLATNPYFFYSEFGINFFDEPQNAGRAKDSDSSLDVGSRFALGIGIYLPIIKYIRPYGSVAISFIYSDRSEHKKEVRSSLGCDFVIPLGKGEMGINITPEYSYLSNKETGIKGHRFSIGIGISDL